MKLREIVRLIPETISFNVEVYKASDEEDMIRAYQVESFFVSDRCKLYAELDRDVIAIVPENDCHGISTLSIAIRDERY